MSRDRNVIRWAEFTLDGDSRQLTRNGDTVRLSPKAFELLLILATNRPRAMSKADLQARLWPDTFVTEANLPGLVKEIRRVLGETPRDNGTLRTLHGYGYAFAAQATGAEDGVGAELPQDTTYWIVGDRRIRLLPGETIFGRDPGATVWFEIPGISRRHARITVARDAAIIEDLGSTNGTWVRGIKVEGPTPLNDGDEIRLGPVRLTFRIRRTAASTEVYHPRGDPPDA